MARVTLAHRAVLEIGGVEAGAFLQRLVTADLDALDARTAMPCALLSPQGKVLHEFLIMRAEVDTGAGAEAGYRIDVSRAFLPDLARRLMLYRLHAAVTFAPRPGASVTATWGEDAPHRDMRFRDGVGRSYDALGDTETLAGWTRRRIEAGVAEIGTDFPADTYFPHDLGLQSNGGIATGKGCYVGQEVVSRMHHRGTGRRRVAVLHAEEAFPAPGTAVEAEGRSIGTLGSATEDTPHRALAVLRIDRAGEAMAAGAPIVAGGVPVTPHVPPGAAWSLAAASLEPVLTEPASAEPAPDEPAPDEPATAT